MVCWLVVGVRLEGLEVSVRNARLRLDFFFVFPSLFHFACSAREQGARSPLAFDYLPKIPTLSYIREPRAPPDSRQKWGEGKGEGGERLVDSLVRPSVS